LNRRGHAQFAERASTSSKALPVREWTLPLGNLSVWLTAMPPAPVRKLTPIAIVILIFLVTTACVSEHLVMGGGANYSLTPSVRVTVVRSDPDVDMAPTLKSPGSPIFYPLEMRRAGQSGEVFATLTIEPDGQISGVVIDRSSQRDFENAVSFGIGKCLFFPARKNGVPVRSIAQCKVEFTLEED
jgi:TonB family protein